ncbi:MAG: homoserine kinase [Magnetococcales bacterium]|nr:homoserine kinase [Magnetococcales bacterium]
MSVYTPVQIQDLESFTLARSLGPPIRLEAIAQGIINSNFRLTTPRGTFILTLVENHEEASALPFVVDLLEQLANRNLPVPRPILDHQGKARFTLSGRPALLVSLLPGYAPDPPNPEQCHQVGIWLGRIHRHGQEFPAPPPGRLRPESWAPMVHRLATANDMIDQDIVSWFKEELSWLGDHWFNRDLPQGLCHGDLFPDNTLFSGDRLTGMIDFYSACAGPWLYDLAVCLCSWCLDDQGCPHPEHIDALLQGYDQVRPRNREEHDGLVCACRAAAFRFSLSRFHDRCFPRQGTTVTRRNPESFMARLRFFQSLADRKWPD